MATEEEYEAVYGPVPAGTTPATEWGDGGCIAIYKGTFYTEAVGRWADRGTAQEVLRKLQKVGGKFAYRLDESHHWLNRTDGAKCTKCGALKPRKRMEWP